MDRETVFEILDPRFARLFIGTARLDMLFSDCRWAEGPAYFPAGRYLVWSDIPNDRMLRYDECNGQVSVFRHPSGHSNGNTVDRAGRLVTCEHGGRRVSRTEVDGTVITLADRFEGKRLNSPNDASRGPTGACGSPTRPTGSIPTMRATKEKANRPATSSIASILRRAA